MRSNIVWYGVIVAFILPLSSCVAPKSRIPIIDEWAKQEAKFYDIPIVINAQPYMDYNNRVDDSNNNQIAYTASLPFGEICSFYEYEMERLGWQLVAVSKGKECLYIYEKPAKQCAVSIRPRGALSDLFIFQIGRDFLSLS
jgi:hypothetical protein